MARVHHTGSQHQIYYPEDLRPGTLVWMPGDFIGIITAEERVMSLSNPVWRRNRVPVRPLKSGESVTLEQEL